MNGAQDLGGMMGFGPVQPEPEDVRFHADWERRALAIVVATGATQRWTIDAARHARESLPPGEYLTSSYYEIWTTGLEALLVDAGLVTAEELAHGRVLEPGEPRTHVLRPGDVAQVLAAGSPYDRPVAETARFTVGDLVRTRNLHPTGHTRLPRYARAKQGVIVRLHSGYVFPDTNAHGAGECPQWLYTVRFEARELWGDSADPTLTVAIDAWESYLDPA
ncbi:MAG TPA: nitrile hydratase subunit beta [Pseudonocardiaceae bacterium]|jgi:nitrile hydratase beta subunit|nr:nitrile hydratase subunit beta [Pseudonocardiaceae bacterium]